MRKMKGQEKLSVQAMLRELVPGRSSDTVVNLHTKICLKPNQSEMHFGPEKS